MRNNAFHVTRDWWPPTLCVERSSAFYQVHSFAPNHCGRQVVVVAAHVLFFAPA